MSTRSLFKQAFAVQRNYGNPARLANQLRTDHLLMYRAAGFCAAQQEQIFIGWVNEERWRTWLRLKMAWWDRRQQANT